MVVLLCAGHEDFSLGFEFTDGFDGAGPPVFELFDGEALGCCLVLEVADEGLGRADVVDGFERVSVRFGIIMDSLIIAEDVAKSVCELDGQARSELICCESDFFVFEVGYSVVDLGHEVPDLSRVCGLRVDDFWSAGGGVDDGAFALEIIGG